MSDWAQPWWPVIVVLPAVGAALGAGLGALTSTRPWRIGVVAVFVGALGPLVGVASAIAWHVIPSGAYWLGGFVRKIDLGYLAIGLLLGLLVTGAAAAAGVLPRLSQPGPS